MTINSRLKELRNYLNLTTRKFGERINITGGAVTNMEKGKRNITDRVIADVCREFNVSEEWLRYGTGEMFINTNISLNSIRERISILRKNLNLNQEEFGKKINVTRSAISNYEKGLRNVMDRVIYDICREFNVNEEWLRHGTGEIFIDTNIYSNSIGERIFILRKKLNLNQEEIGNNIGVTKATISRLEKGINNFTEQMIKSICREFNVNEEWLRYGFGEMFTLPNQQSYSELVELMNKIYSEIQDIKKEVVNTNSNIENIIKPLIKEFDINTEDINILNNKIDDIQYDINTLNIKILKNENNIIYFSKLLKEINENK